jgi:hypothetical protein
MCSRFLTTFGMTGSYLFFGGGRGGGGGAPAPPPPPPSPPRSSESLVNSSVARTDELVRSSAFAPPPPLAGVEAKSRSFCRSVMISSVNNFDFIDQTAHTCLNINYIRVCECNSCVFQKNYGLNSPGLKKVVF